MLLAKQEILQSGKNSISITDLKSEYFNRNYLQTIFTKLDLQHELLKNRNLTLFTLLVIAVCVNSYPRVMLQPVRF
jgi:hypothetical protein